MTQPYIKIVMDNSKLFDASVHGTDGTLTLRDGGDLLIITKHQAMKSGAAAACLCFSVEVSGKMVRAQTVTSVKILKAMLVALSARYDDEGIPR